MGERDSSLRDEPRLHGLRWNTVHRLLSIRTRRQDIRVQSRSRPGTQMSRWPGLVRYEKSAGPALPGLPRDHRCGHHALTRRRLARALAC